MRWQQLKLGEEEGRERQAALWHLSSQVTVLPHGALLSWKGLNPYRLMGSGE